MKLFAGSNKRGKKSAAAEAQDEASAVEGCLQEMEQRFLSLIRRAEYGAVEEAMFDQYATELLMKTGTQKRAGIRDLFQRNVSVILGRQNARDNKRRAEKLLQKNSHRKKYPDSLLPAHLFQQ